MKIVTPERLPGATGRSARHVRVPNRRVEETAPLLNPDHEDFAPANVSAVAKLG
jgi:hypothetical protein